MPATRSSISEPAWFCYEPMLLAADAVPRKVAAAARRPSISTLPRSTRRSDRDAARHRQHAAQSDRTHLRPATLEALADLLERASARIGQRIFLLSDEPYRRLRFDGRGFVSPAALYPWTLISYSYGKVLLAPGQRLGYLAISPLMPAADRQALRDVMFSAQMALGWCFPNAVMQYAVPDLDKLSIDQAALARRRDRLTAALSRAGYSVLAAGGHVLPLGQMAGGRSAAAMERARRPRRLRHARQHHECAGLFPHQPDGIGRDGGTGVASIYRSGMRRGSELTRRLGVAQLNMLWEMARRMSSSPSEICRCCNPCPKNKGRTERLTRPRKFASHSSFALQAEFNQAAVSRGGDRSISTLPRSNYFGQRE